MPMTPMPAETIATIQRLYGAGASAKEVAAHFQRKVSWAQNAIYRFRIKSGSHRLQDWTGRFFHYVDKQPSGCWMWLGAKDRKGYGQMRVNDVLRIATHLSLEIAGRPLPEGMHACHHCDQPSCVNPEHLFAGTRIENMQDCKSKGRMANPPRSGSDASAAKRAERMLLVCGPDHRKGENALVWSSGYVSCRKCMARRKADASSAVGAWAGAPTVPSTPV